MVGGTGVIIYSVWISDGIASPDKAKHEFDCRLTAENLNIYEGMNLISDVTKPQDEAKHEC